MSSAIENKNVTELGVDLLSSNLRFLMAKMGIDASKLYESTGIAVTTINNLRRASGNPTLSTLQSLSEFFDVTIGDLTEKNLANTQLKQLGSLEVPLVDLNEVDDFFNSPHKGGNSIVIELEKNIRENAFAIKITNNSMAPYFDKGTVFVLGRDIPAQDGDLVLVKFGNNPPCFRKVFLEEETYFFSHISELLGKDLYKSKNFSIYGVVIKAIQYFYE